MRHIYLWDAVGYGSTDYVNRLKSGKIFYERPFGSLGSTEATLDFWCETEEEAFTTFSKGLKVKITDDAVSGDRLDGQNLFVGYVDRHNWREDTKTVRVTLKDALYFAKDKPIGPVTFVEQKLSQIISWLADKVDLGLRLLPDTGRIDPSITYAFFDDTTIGQVLDSIARDLGGKLYLAAGREPHVLVVEYACLYEDYEAVPVQEITLDDVKDVNIDYPPREANVFEVKCKSKSLITTKVFEGASYDNPFNVPVGGIGSDEEHCIRFDRPVIYVDEIKFDADPNLEFDNAVWESNFADGDVSRNLLNPYEAKIKIDNSTAVEGYVWVFWIKGRAVKEDEVVETQDNSGTSIERRWSITSDLITAPSASSSGQDWNKRRVAWEAARRNQQFSLKSVNNFVPFFGPRASISGLADYIIDVNGAVFAIERLTVDLDSGRWDIHGSGDRSEYISIGGGGRKIIPSVPPGEEPPEYERTVESITVKAKISNISGGNAEVFIRWRGLLGSYSTWEPVDEYTATGEHSRTYTGTLSIVGQPVANLYIQIKVVLPKASVGPTILEWLKVYVNDIQYAYETVEDFTEQMSPDSSNIEIGESGGITFVQAYAVGDGEYITTSFIEKQKPPVIIPPVQTGIFGALVHVGEISFPGDSLSGIVQEVFHNKDLDPAKYVVSFFRVFEESPTSGHLAVGPRVIEQKRNSIKVEFFGEEKST